MTIENEKKYLNASLLFVSFALAMAVLSWTVYVEVMFFTPETAIIAPIIFSSAAAILFFSLFGYPVCCVVSCLPWFWIRSTFSARQFDSLFVATVSWGYWGIITIAHLFPISMICIGISGVSTHGDHRLIESIVTGITLALPIALLALAVASIFALTSHNKAWIIFMLAGNFLLALACLGARLTIFRALYQI